jgi:hypothetical protein
MIDTLKLAAAAALALAALLIWFAFLRQVPTHSAPGMIVEKVYKPEGTYEQHQHGLDRGFRVPVRIPLAEGYILVVDLDEPEEGVAVPVNMIQARQYETGHRVEVDYQIRGIPGVWERLTVTDVRRLQGN